MEDRSMVLRLAFGRCPEAAIEAVLHVAEGGGWLLHPDGTRAYPYINGPALELFARRMHGVVGEPWKTVLMLLLDSRQWLGSRGRRLPDSWWIRRLLLLWQAQWILHWGEVTPGLDEAFEKYVNEQLNAGTKPRELRLVMPWEVGICPCKRCKPNRVSLSEGQRRDE